MYKKDLQNLLRGSYFPNFFALYGDNFQSELFGEMIKQRWGADEILRLYFEEYDFKTAQDFLDSASLFSEKKLLELKITGKKFSAKDIKELGALISLCKQGGDNFFLLQIYDADSKLGEIEKVFENNFARFFKITSPKEAAELLALRANQLEIEFSQAALYTLFENFDEDLYLAASELNKFKGLRIDQNSIEKYCYSLSVASVDSLFDKLLQGKDVRQELEKILESQNEIALLNALNRDFYRLFKITLYAKITGEVSFKEILGYAPPPQVAKKLQTQAFGLNLKQYERIFTLFLESEYALKCTPKLVKKEFLLSSLITLSQIIKNKK